MPNTVVVWFRRDLRLHDNPALCTARKDGARIVPVYIFSPDEEDPWPPGAASRWWLHHSLAALGADLSRLQSRLLIFRGDSLSLLMMLCQRIGARTVYWNRLYDPAIRSRDDRVRIALHAAGIRSRSFAGYLVREPWELMTGGGTPYKVFTPYSRASLQLGDPAPPLGGIRASDLVDADLRDDGLDALQLLPHGRWDAGLYEHWTAGEAAAWRRVDSFIASRAAGYDQARDRPGRDGISRLSPHLHFGEISPGSLWHSVAHGLGAAGGSEYAHPYLRQLLWRDFAHQLLYHCPGITERNYKPAFDAFPWREDSALADAWRSGATGIPLVDAGMRELWRTGFMHNRVRMNAASFLTKNAGVHWRAGARWFWDTLVDANLANNTMGWQWVAGSGPDAAPYFRIFNPVIQGQRFDPRGEYVRRWLPVLAALPDKYVHAPWTAPAGVLSRAGVRLGANYPKPVLDLKETRQTALESYERYVKRK